MFRSLTTSILASALLLAGCAGTDDGPRAAEESLKGPPVAAPIVVVAVAKVKPGTEVDFRDAALTLTAGSRSEAGNLGYQLQQSAEDPTTFLFYEQWASKRASDEHMNGAVLGTFFNRVKDEFEPGFPTITAYKPLEPGGPACGPPK